LIKVFENLIIAIVITKTHKEEASHLLRCLFFSSIDISVAENYLICRGDFPKEIVTITHKAKLEQAKAEITPKKKLFQTIIILLFS
jgi:hypothetical protein